MTLTQDKNYDLPLQHDFYLYRGDSFQRGIRLKDEATNTYIDLSNVEVRAQARETVYSTNVIFNFIAGIADQSDPDTVGLIYLEVPMSAWVNLPIFDEPVKFAEYDLELLWPFGKKTTYLYGDLYIKGDTTR